MREWRQISISDIGRVVTGNTPPRKNPELYGNHTIFIKPTDISEETKFTYNPEECYSELGYRKYKNSLIPKGATCVVTIGSIGKKMTKAHCDCFINQAVNAVIPSEEFDHEFVYYVLKHNLNQLKVLDSGTASGRENVSKSSFSSIKINVPVNKRVQAKIGNILSAYDDLIENNLKRIKLLEELAQRTYEEWFVKFRVNGVELAVMEETGLPEGWEKKNLFEISEIHYGFPFKANQFNSDGNGTPIIRIRNIPNSDTNDFTTEKVAEKYWVNKGDLLIGMDGEFYINNWSGPRAYLVQRSCNIKAKDKFLHGYLSQAIVAPVKFFEATISGATVAHLGKKHLETIQLVIPSEEYRGHIEKFNSWLNLKISLATQNRLLKQSRDILLPRLMSGEMEV
jgi:type I restriction enzyme S subunit